MCLVNNCLVKSRCGVGKRIGWDRPPDPWALPFGRASTDQELAEIAVMHDGVCRLCRRTDQQLVYEHDHAVGIHALRQLTCQRCNAHMTGVDAGRYAVDPATRKYIMEPWYLARLGERLPYDPAVPVCISKLSSADRREVDRLSREHAIDIYGMRKAQPRFEHEALAAASSHGDTRTALRLRYLNIRGFHDLDITQPDDRLSSFQRVDLPRLAAAQRVAEQADISVSRIVAEALKLQLPHVAAVIERQRQEVPIDEWADFAADAA